MARRVFFAAAGVAALGVVATLVNFLMWPNRAVVRNSSGDTIREVTLVLSKTDGTVFLEKSVARLGPGERMTARHDCNDSRGRLSFILRGRSHTYEEAYIDLWTGESWLFDIQPNGTVVANYGHILEK